VWHVCLFDWGWVLLTSPDGLSGVGPLVAITSWPQLVGEFLCGYLVQGLQTIGWTQRQWHATIFCANIPVGCRKGSLVVRMMVRAACWFMGLCNPVGMVVYGRLAQCNSYTNVPLP